MSTNDEFSEAIYISGPLHFDGYRFIDFYCSNKRLKIKPDHLWSGIYEQYKQDWVLPENNDLSMAVWFALQRGHKNYGFPSGPDAPEDGQWFGNLGMWTHFYLLFLHLYNHTFPSYFELDRQLVSEWKILGACGAKLEVATKVRLELIGYRGGHLEHPFTSRIGSLEAYHGLARSASESQWLPKMAAFEKDLKSRPELVLALSFKANGFSQMMSKPNSNFWQPDKAGTPYLVEKTLCLLSSKMAFLADDDENRAVMFMLAQWLLEHPDQENFNSRDYLVFCLLYLHLYRLPLSQYFTRSTFAKLWQTIPFKTKETVAAKMRRDLAYIRNKAAKTFPFEPTPDTPLS